MKRRVLILILFLLAFSGTAAAQPAAPTGPANQTFCSGGLVSDIVVTGTDIKWYDSPSGGSEIPGTTALVTATHYYATQTVATEESTDRLDVLVTIDIPVITGTPTICGTGTTTLSGSGTPAGSNPWVSDATGVAIVTNSGVVTGVSAGTVNITYTDDIGCSTSVTITVYPAATISGTLTICGTGTTTLTGSGTPAGSNPWTSGDTGVAAVDDDGIVTGVTPGTSLITYTDDNGCFATATVTVYALPLITGTPDVCVGATTTLSGSGAPAATDPWLSGTPANATISNTGLLTGVAAGSSIITYTDNNGCSNTVSATVNALPGAPTATPTQSFCPGATVSNLTATGTALKWYTAASGGSALLSTDVLATGSYYVSQTIGCESSARFEVTVTIYAAPVISGTLDVCVGSTTNLSGTGTPAVSNPWISANTGVATITSGGVVTGVLAGTSQITYTDINGCTITATVNVHARPVPVITGSNAVCAGSTGNVYSTTAGMTNYQWVISAGGSISSGGGTGDNTVTVTWTTTGAKTVSVNYIDTHGCTAVSSAVYNITVEPDNITTDSIKVTGSMTVGGKLSVSYNFKSPECFTNTRSGNKYIWYKSSHSDHSPADNFTTKTGDSTLVITSGLEGNYLQVRVQLYNGSGLQPVVEGTWTDIKVTANSKPVADTIIISGTALVGQTLTAGYSYYDAEGDPAATPGYQWFRAVDVNGTITGKIAGATASTYTITSADGGKYIGVKIKPKASAGTSPGDTATMKSPWFGPVVTNKPVVSNLRILGEIHSGMTIFSAYDYYDVENDPQGASIIKWYTADNNAGTGPSKTKVAATSSYKIKDGDIGKYIGFSVVPVANSGASPGDSVTLSTFAGTVSNDIPVATNVSITGTSFNVNDVLSGSYDYSDYEGDIQGTSLYEWWRSPNNTLASATKITTATSILYQLTLADTGKYLFFKVKPKALTGSLTGTQVATLASNKVNTPPYAALVSISGTTNVGQVLTGNYVYHDGDGNTEAGTTFRWMRDGIPIDLATSSTYTITYEDEGSTLSFEVTPRSSTGYPNTGNPVISTSVGPVANTSSSVPVASEVCIQGRRDVGAVLTGKYKYDFPSKAEGSSTLRWLRRTPVLPETVPVTYTYSEIGTGLTYTIQPGDLNETDDICFEVTPKSGTPVKTGVTVLSYPLARITLPQDHYSALVDTVILTANVTGGVFSGPGVTNCIFSPKSVGDSIVPYRINYFYDTINATTVCTQEAFKDVTVAPGGTYFDGYPIEIFACQENGLIKIQVGGVDTTIFHPYIDQSYGFYLYTYGVFDRAYNDSVIKGGFLSVQNSWTAFLDPKKMHVGRYIDDLYFYYVKDGNWTSVWKPVEIEQVRTSSVISNLKDAYCKDEGAVNISVDGLSPAGGTSKWTGDILSNKDEPIAVLNPQTAAVGNFPISYQYETPKGCKSTVLNDNVKINPLPVPVFSLDAYYNLDGEPDILVPSIAPGGFFTGTGVSGNRFFPGIAGRDVHEITYNIVDENGCSAQTSMFTTVLKAQGSIDIPGITTSDTNKINTICYRDYVYDITINDLPAGVTVDTLLNSSKSLVTSSDNRSAYYNIKNTGAGYDTISLRYTWHDVNFTIRRIVYIDEIGKIAVTGYKDDYCDYDGPAALSVIVENSTGSGSFSFSGPDTSFTNLGPFAVFYPSKTPPSPDPYIVSYTHVSTVNGSGCTKTVEIPVTVNQSPSIAILNTRTTVNIKEAPITLTGNPSDGIFSGKGVYQSGTQYVFDPKAAGLGDIEIAMSFTDSKGCLATKKDTLIVEQASGNISGVNAGNQYCYDGIPDTLTYSSVKPWFSGVFSGPGITNISSAKAVFDPSAAGRGDHEVSFTYSDAAGTVFDVSQSLNVDSLGQIEIKADKFFPGVQLCNNMDPFELYVSHKGGLFDGPVISGSLDPSRAIGDTAVIYTFTNQKTGCYITGRVPFTILNAPVISFTTADVCIDNNADSISFINHTTSVSPVSKWEWAFSDVGGTDGSNEQNPRYLFKTGGLHLTTLTATAENTCSATKTSTIDIGIKPTAGFHWKNECFIPDTQDSLLLFDATDAPSPIIYRSWSFSGGGIYSVNDTVKYLKGAVGFIPVEYIVRTKYPNCFDRIVKNIFIRPTVKLTGDNYFENFESGNGGWVRGDESTNSWAFGTPDRSVINSAASGTSAWYTSFDVADQKVDSSSIVSPCFDFTATERPMINLKMWKHFDINRDGAALQYRIGDIGSWQYIGSLEDGINWYNSTLIKGRPGGEQIGWTTVGTPDNRWIEARHELDELKGKKDVKFRIVYGSDGNSQNNDGFAFDDILISERSRNVLIEHFANYSSSASNEATKMIDDYALLNKEDIINIQYHTNFPGVDSFYLDNPGDASARILFYGLTKAPYAFVDGGTGNYASIFDFTDKELDGSLVKINGNEISRRTLINPVFDIDLNPPVITGGVLQLGGRLKALQDLTSENLTLYLAVTEKINSDYTGTGGINTFHNVFRKFIPDAGGIELRKSWAKDDESTFPDQTWVIEKTLNSSDIDIIAFIQDNVTKQVFQAVSVSETNISTQNEKPGRVISSGFALYPNPARARLTIDFGEMTDRELTISIYDFRGAVTKTYIVPSGELQYIIDDLGLPDGIYLVRISAGGIDYGFKKLIITGS